MIYTYNKNPLTRIKYKRRSKMELIKKGNLKQNDASVSKTRRGPMTCGHPCKPADRIH